MRPPLRVHYLINLHARNPRELARELAQLPDRASVHCAVGHAGMPDMLRIEIPDRRHDTDDRRTLSRRQS